MKLLIDRATRRHEREYAVRSDNMISRVSRDNEEEDYLLTPKTSMSVGESGGGQSAAADEGSGPMLDSIHVFYCMKAPAA